MTGSSLIKTKIPIHCPECGGEPVSIEYTPYLVPICEGIKLVGYEEVGPAEISAKCAQDHNWVLEGIHSWEELGIETE